MPSGVLIGRSPEPRPYRSACSTPAAAGGVGPARPDRQAPSTARQMLQLPAAPPNLQLRETNGDGPGGGWSWRQDPNNNQDGSGKKKKEKKEKKKKKKNLWPDHRRAHFFWQRPNAARAVILTTGNLPPGGRSGWPAVDEARRAGEQAAEGLTEALQGPRVPQTGSPQKTGTPAGDRRSVALDQARKSSPADAESRYFSLTPVPGFEK